MTKLNGCDCHVSKLPGVLAAIMNSGAHIITTLPTCYNLTADTHNNLAGSIEVTKYAVYFTCSDYQWESLRNELGVQE